MSTRIDLQLSYILHTRAYRDTSLLVDVLTKDYGKITVIAKGARKSKSSQRYLLQPFSPVLLSWQGKSSLKTLVGIESVASEHIATGSLGTTPLQGKKLYSAMYANELLTFLLQQDDPSDHIFQCYQYLLKQLCFSDRDIECCLREFEFSLLSELGYGINFDYEANSGSPIEAINNYIFVQNHGFVLADDYMDIRDPLFMGKAILNIRDGLYEDKETRQAAKILSRITLRPHLKGRQLKSRELFLAIKPESFINKS